MDDQGLDKLLFFTVVALTLIGLVMVFSSSCRIAMETTNADDASFFLRRHVIRVVLGFILLYVFTRVSEGNLRSMAAPLLLFSVALLVLVLLPTSLRHSVRGSSRWLKMGPFSFQPSDLARVALILYIAD